MLQSCVLKDPLKIHISVDLEVFSVYMYVCLAAILFQMVAMETWVLYEMKVEVMIVNKSNKKGS